jgi:hypothetical protein
MASFMQNLSIKKGLVGNVRAQVMVVQLNVVQVDPRILLLTASVASSIPGDLSIQKILMRHCRMDKICVFRKV